jgi:hypothetical protein
MTVFTRILLPLFCAWVWTVVVADNVPVAPLNTQKDAEWGEVYQLTTKYFTLLVSPVEAALVSLKFRNGEEHLQAPIKILAGDFSAFPTTASVWENRAWRTSEGQQVVMLAKSFGPPLSLRVVHLIETMPDGNAFRQLTRISSTGPGNPSYFKPKLSFHLTATENSESKDPSVLYLNLPDALAAWQVQWQLEQPEMKLEGDLKIRKNPQSLEGMSAPELHLLLPPQGWTLLCNLQMVYKLSDPEIPSTEQVLKWPSSLN